MKQRIRWNEEYAREVLAEAEASGLSDEQFARRRGLHPMRLKRWRTKLGRGVGGGVPRFAEVVGKDRGGGRRASEQRVEVVLGNGRRLLLPEGVGGGRVVELVRALEDGRC